MATDGDLVPLEQSDMCLVLNIPKLGKGVFSCLPIEEMQFVITNARADV
jgi:hypothetical protein